MDPRSLRENDFDDASSSWQADRDAERLAVPRDISQDDNRTRAIVRRRGTVDETYSRDTRPARSEAFALSPDVLAGVSVAGCLPSQDRPHVSQLADLVPGGTARIPGTGGSIHLVVPPLRNTTSHVRPGGGSARAGSATNHIVATASPRTRIMSGRQGWGRSRVRSRGRVQKQIRSPQLPPSPQTRTQRRQYAPYRCPARGTPGATVTSLSSRLDGKPRSGIALRCLGSPLELAGRANGAHDHNAGWLEPVGVLARERGPASGVLVARAVAFGADQQHVPRHLGADLRGFAGSAQVAGRAVSRRDEGRA